MKTSLEAHPEIAQAYALYQVCRSQSVYDYEFEKNKKTMRLILNYTTGLAMLPEEGSLMDQPERLITFFEEFLAGDEAAFHRRLREKR